MNILELYLEKCIITNTNKQWYEIKEYEKQSQNIKDMIKTYSNYVTVDSELVKE